MAVAVASIGAVAGSTGTTMTPGAPAGVAVGDLLLLCCTARHDGANQFFSASGWTQAVLTKATSQFMYSAILYRVADGTASDTPTVSFSVDPAFGQQSVILRLTGQDAAWLNDTDGATAAITNSVAVPAMTVTADGSLALAVVAQNTSDVAEQ